MAALQFVQRLQRSVSGKALLLLTSPEGRRSAGRETVAPVPGEAPAATRDLSWAALPSHCPRGRLGSCPAAAGGQAVLTSLWGQLETSRLPRPKSRDIKLTLSSSGAEAGAKGATGKRKGSRQNPESSR